jgi:hypothetical protein
MSMSEFGTTIRGFKKIGRSGSALLLAILLLGNTTIALAKERKTYSKADPIRLDFDMESIPEPKGYDTGYFYDFADGTFFQQAKQAFDFPRHYRNLSGNPKQAYNVNTLDEVPNSSWFTNRNGLKPMTVEEIKRGPNKTDGPAAGKLIVVSVKSRGAQPGLWVKDERGDTYILKFDTPQYPELSTAAEVISTKLFYAIGYNVPQNTIYRFNRDQLILEGKKSSEKDKKKEITDADIDEVLKRVARQSDGRYRCVASKLLSGKVKGNFKFYGVHKDDPNDIIPHEHRRDLRALKVFSAWLNHVDMRTENTMNLYVTEDGRKFIRHYLFDFGATLGSFSTRPKPEWAGHEYGIDAGESMKSLLTLGTYPKPWLNRSKELRYPSLGFFDSKYFEPGRWKQLFPLVAFENLTDEDAYWAAKIVGSFTEEQIRAAVETGELSDPDASGYLIEQLFKRREIILQNYLTHRAAIDHFKIDKSGEGFAMSFKDLRAELFEEGSGRRDVYEYELRSAANPKSVFDKGTLADPEIKFSKKLLEKIKESGKSEEDRSVAQLSLRRRGEAQDVQVYLFYNADRNDLRIVGVEN